MDHNSRASGFSSNKIYLESYLIGENLWDMVGDNITIILNAINEDIMKSRGHWMQKLNLC